MNIAERTVLAQGSRSFGFAARFLPADQWDDAARVYAFCRDVDDVADDERLDPELRLLALQRRTDALDGRGAVHAVSALLDTHARRGLDLDAARELIAGCRSDIAGVHVQSDRELLRYGYRVASTVGLLMCGVLGVQDPRARPFAIDLGVAMQLTNICRDVLEDAHIGRVYLPESRLRAAGTSGAELVAGDACPAAVRRVVLEVLDLAEVYYRSGSQGLHFLPWRARGAIAVAARVYRRIGVDLRRRGGDALAGRTVVGALAKTAEATRALLGLLTPRALGWSPPTHDATLHIPLAGLPGTQPPDGLHALQDQDGLGNDRHPEEHAHRLGATVRAAGP